MFGVVLTQKIEVTDTIVEEYLKEIFIFIDSTLALFNKLVDRRFEAMLETIYPQLNANSSARTEAGRGGGHVLSSPSDKISQTTIAPLNKGPKSKSATKVAVVVETTPVSIDYRKPPAILRLFWHEILLYCTSILDSFVDEIGEHEIRQAMIVDSMIEFCKTIFHCKLGGTGKPIGLLLPQLETGLYMQLRRSLDQVLKT